jgi:hypothetical protein
MNLYVRETYIDATKHSGIGGEDWYEAFTADLGRLYRDLQATWGRCISAMYRGEGQKVGWVFQGREKYDDSKETYLREVWVEVSTVEPRKVWSYDPEPVSPWAKP